MNVLLKPSSWQIVSRNLRSGRFRSPSDVIDHALRILEELDEASTVDPTTNPEPIELTNKQWEQIRREVRPIAAKAGE